MLDINHLGACWRKDTAGMEKRARGASWNRASRKSQIPLRDSADCPKVTGRVRARAVPSPGVNPHIFHSSLDTLAPTGPNRPRSASVSSSGPEGATGCRVSRRGWGQPGSCPCRRCGGRESGTPDGTPGLRGAPGRRPRRGRGLDPSVPACAHGVSPGPRAAQGCGTGPRPAPSARRRRERRRTCSWQARPGEMQRGAGHFSNSSSAGRASGTARRRSPPLSPAPWRRSSPGAMQRGRVRAALAALLCAALLPLRPEAARAPKQRPARTRSCGERPEELLEQLYGRLAAGMLSAFHHTLQPEPPGRQHNASCPAGARPPADKRVRLPVNLRSASPWAYRISYDPTRYPKYIPEAYCLCKGCLMGIFGEESLHFRSTPVFMPTVILRRTPACAGGRYVYTEDYITIPVGCTCVPEQEKEAESANSSIDKQEVKLLVGQNKPSSE
ncbi:interleukin-17D [Taeniopygia guttata]|uniref:interleukin-17D n=1 Tax=Taeniopygia guttata TaxID=59729 RepID=UPI003BB9A6D1